MSRPRSADCCAIDPALHWQLGRLQVQLKFLASFTRITGTVFAWNTVTVHFSRQTELAAGSLI
jgi:hypothetical protein